MGLQDSRVMEKATEAALSVIIASNSENIAGNETDFDVDAVHALVEDYIQACMDEHKDPRTGLVGREQLGDLLLMLVTRMMFVSGAIIRRAVDAMAEFDPAKASPLDLFIDLTDAARRDMEVAEGATDEDD